VALVIFLHGSLSLYQKLCITLNDAFHLLCLCLSTNIQTSLVNSHPSYYCKWNSWSNNIKYLLKTYCPILSYIFLFLLILLVSIALTVTSTVSVLCFDLCVGQINPGTFGAAHTSCCSGYSSSSKQLSSTTSDSLSASQSSSLWLGFSKSQFQLSEFSVSEMLSGALLSSLSASWRCVCHIQRTFNTWVHPPASYLADKAVGNGDLSDGLKAAAPSCWKFVQEALTLSSISEMYSMAVISLFWAHDSFCVVRWFWLPCHISKKSWTLAILCDFLSSASLFNSKLLSVSDLCNAGSSPANILRLPRAICLSTSYSRKISPVVFDWLQPITSHPREKLASTPTPCGMIGRISRATLERSACFECVSSCWRHHSVISGDQNVLQISIMSEW